MNSDGDDKKKADGAPAADAPKPAPVMDVVPPQNNPPSSETPRKDPDELDVSELMTPKDPPPEESDSKKDTPPSEAVAAELKKEKPGPAPKPIKPPKQPGNGVGMAIVGTVVIVLGLAALAVYAYLQSQK